MKNIEADGDFGHQKQVLAQQAKLLFVHVSMTNPASAIGQAARIAERCKELGLSPRDMGDSLLAFPDLLKEIQELGNQRHKHAGVSKIKGLSLGSVVNVISSDFGMAEEMMTLTDKQLKEVYLKYGNRPTTNFQERQLVERVSLWLKANDVDFYYPSGVSEAASDR